MKRKNELSTASSSEHLQEQVVNCLIGDKLVDSFGNSVKDIKNKILSYLTEEELKKAHNHVALTCKTQLGLFKPNFKMELVHKLLTAVAMGEQDKAERLLKTSPELMLEKITCTDCSGRTFSNISAFEFILWALDTRYMFNMMLNCLPLDESGLAIAQKLQEQYDYHEKHGVTYSKIKENHFDFSVLINALQAYVDNFNEWDWKERTQHWCTVVGRAQCTVPAHVMQHYFDINVPFYPLPKFEADQFIRSLKCYDVFEETNMTWHGVGTTHCNLLLGMNFGIYRSSLNAGSIAGRLSYIDITDVGRDSAAVSALCKVRTADYRAIPSKLASFQKKVSIDETPTKGMSS